MLVCLYKCENKHTMPQQFKPFEIALWNPWRSIERNWIVHMHFFFQDYPWPELEGWDELVRHAPYTVFNIVLLRLDLLLIIVTMFTSRGKSVRDEMIATSNASLHWKIEYEKLQH